MQTKTKIDSSPVGELVRKMEQNYRMGSMNISKYVSHNMLETLNTIDAYHYSKHISGDTDSLGREKPFPNIVISAEHIWYRATDIDRGNIKIKSTKAKNTINAFLKTIHIQNWMRKENFGLFLNQWGRTLSRYGSAVLKFIEKDGKLHRNVVSWQTLIVDEIDFENNPVIEVLDLTEAQLRNRVGYNQKIVDKLCEAKSTRKTIEGQAKDNKSEYIRLYEVHGELPLSYLTGKEKDEYTYVQQMHVVSFLENKDGFDDFALFSGKEKESPYMITHLIAEENRTLSIGPVEYLFDAQWMQCHTAKAIKDQLDIAGMILFQTSDGTFVGQNAIAAMVSGDILIHAPNQPLTQVANNSHDITSLQSFGSQWKVLGNEITGISESMLGNTAPSGTAWRQVETLLNESHDLFDLMRENKGLYIQEMFKKYIIPFINKKMDTKEEISATLESYDITRIDGQYVKNMSTKIVNRHIVESVLNDQSVTTEQQIAMTNNVASQLQQGLSDQGNQRFFTPDEIGTMTWKELFKDSDDEVEVDVTGENVDKDAMTTLNTLLMYIAKKNGQPMTPEEKFVFDAIIRQTGVVSPLELSALPKPSPIQPQPLAANTPAAAGAVGA